jgi:hypothetical protein
MLGKERERGRRLLRGGERGREGGGGSKGGSDLIDNVVVWNEIGEIWGTEV